MPGIRSARCGTPGDRPIGIDYLRGSWEGWAVADLGFLLLTVAAFAVLVLVLRGSERL